MPLPAPVPPSPETSKAILEAFAACGIEFHPGTTVTSIDPDRRVAVLADGGNVAHALDGVHIAILVTVGLAAVSSVMALFIRDEDARATMVARQRA